MQLVNIRNRFKIETTWGTSDTLIYELRFFYPGESIPTNPTYTIEKTKYAVEILPYFDLSKFAKDYLLKEPFKPNAIINEPDFGYAFVNVEVSTIKDSVITTEDYGCLYGYQENQSFNTSYLLYPDIPVKVSGNACVGLVLEVDSYTITYFDTAGGVIGVVTLVTPNINVYNITLSYIGVLASSVTISNSGGLLHTILVENIGECNKRGTLAFRNSYGGISFMDVYGEVVKSVNTERNKFEYLDNTRGRAVDNRQNHYTFTINTGWLSEQYNTLVESLFISPLVYIDDTRIIIEGPSVELKTRVRDGLFQYIFTGTASVNFADY